MLANSQTAAKKEKKIFSWLNYPIITDKHAAEPVFTLKLVCFYL